MLAICCALFAVGLVGFSQLERASPGLRRTARTPLVLGRGVGAGLAYLFILSAAAAMTANALASLHLVERVYPGAIEAAHSSELTRTFLFGSVAAGLGEEILLFAVPIALARRSKWSPAAVLTLVIALRLAIHTYYGWGSLFVLLWIPAGSYLLSSTLVVWRVQWPKPGTVTSAWASQRSTVLVAQSCSFATSAVEPQARYSAATLDRKSCRAAARSRSSAGDTCSGRRAWVVLPLYAVAGGGVCQVQKLLTHSGSRVVCLELSPAISTRPVPVMLVTVQTCRLATSSSASFCRVITPIPPTATAKSSASTSPPARTAPAGRLFFRDLTARALSGVKLVTSDAHAGLAAAIGATLPGASWQRCRTHYAVNLMGATPKTSWPGVRALLHSIHDQPDAKAVDAQYDRVLDTLTEKLSKVAEHLEAPGRT